MEIHLLLLRCTDVTKTDGNVALDVEADALMTSLKTSIANKLTADNIKSYELSWKGGGIDIEDADHTKYLKKMSEDFIDNMKGMISEEIIREQERQRKAVTHVVTIPRPTSAVTPAKAQGKNKRVKGRTKGGEQKNDMISGAAMGGFANPTEANFLRGFMTMNCLVQEHQAIEKGDCLATIEARVKLDLYSEISHHLTFCKNRCDVFFGREGELAVIKNYVTSFREAAPIVVTSSAGGGKTSFLAKVAALTKDWLGDHAVTIVRFFGISPKSSTLLSMLAQLCAHISLAYGEHIPHHAFNHIRTAQMCFQDLLVMVSNENVVFCLHSIAHGFLSA